MAPSRVRHLAIGAREAVRLRREGYKARAGGAGQGGVISGIEGAMGTAIGAREAVRLRVEKMRKRYQIIEENPKMSRKRRETDISRL